MIKLNQNETRFVSGGAEQIDPAIWVSLTAGVFTAAYAAPVLYLATQENAFPFGSFVASVLTVATYGFTFVYAIA